MTFHVQILGTSAAIPTTKRNVSAQVVNYNERLYLMDCGEGTQHQMIRRKNRFHRLDAIFISHVHGDHVLGLPGMLTTMGLYERTQRLKLYAPADVKKMLDTVFKCTQSYLPYPLEFYPTEEYQPGQIIYQTDRFQVRILPLKHRVFARGFRFEEVNKRPKFDFFRAKDLGIPNHYFTLLKQGNPITLEDGRTIQPEDVLNPPDNPLSYAYCSDTSYHEPLVEWIKGSNLLYHEATFLEQLRERAISTGHSTAKDAATIAQKSEVEKLLLGHFSARYKELDELRDEAREIFPETYLAEDGFIYTIKSKDVQA